MSTAAIASNSSFERRCRNVSIRCAPVGLDNCAWLGPAPETLFIVACAAGDGDYRAGAIVVTEVLTLPTKAVCSAGVPPAVARVSCPRSANVLKGCGFQPRRKSSFGACHPEQARVERSEMSVSRGTLRLPKDQASR